MTHLPLLLDDARGKSKSDVADEVDERADLATIEEGINVVEYRAGMAAVTMGSDSEEAIFLLRNTWGGDLGLLEGPQGEK